MSKKAGIIISLVLALVFTLLIVNSANKKYIQVAGKVKVAQVTEFIPAGTEINDTNVKVMEVMKSAAPGLVDINEAIGKTAKVSMVKDQYVYATALDDAKAVRPGKVEVFIPVDLSSSACAIPGQMVNVYIINKDEKKAPLILENMRVLHCLDNQGDNVGNGGNDISKAAARKNEPSSVGLEIPKDMAEMVVFAASSKLVYLTRSGS